MKKKIWNGVLYTLLGVLLITNVVQFVSYRNSFSKLDQLEELISQRFIGEYDETVLEDMAAAAMIQATGDRWSFYVPADQFDAFQEQMNNAYVGIGITIRPQEDGSGFLILSVTPGSPAEEAGILPGDAMVEIQGQSTEGMDGDGARNLVRGPEGTTVEIAVLREGEKLPLTVERRQIETPVAEGRMVTDDIGLVTIYNFDSRCSQETIASIEDLRTQGAQKLIFDVRYNPGGYAHELVKVLDYLLPEGDLFRTVDYAGREHVDTSDANYLDMPMAVLVNGDSYSAAEFFAAALRDYDAAVIVGEQTCGKGYFQQTSRLNDGSSVNLSVGKDCPPTGESLAGIGITPDVELSVDEETAFGIQAGIIADQDDPQLQAAIQALQQEP